MRVLSLSRFRASSVPCSLSTADLAHSPYCAFVARPPALLRVLLLLLLTFWPSDLVYLQVNYTRGSPQWQWLLDDLRRVNRSATPWVLFGGHRPLYVDSDYDGDVQVASLYTWTRAIVLVAPWAKS